ncbi:hypothetical protein [Leucobacter salsicius]|uniref:hypothetical protein n=1 Tax=Leucobacter salsicius TaxID=664638 RepID=UPI0018DC7CCF|nr:hypothetical protein [Leucobacter salsicius]
MRKQARAAARQRRDLAGLSRTVQVLRSTVSVGDDDIDLDDVLSGAVGTGEATLELASDVGYLDDGMDADTILGSGAAADAGDLAEVTDAIPDMGDVFDQAADADDEAHEGRMRAIEGAVDIDAALAAAGQAAQDAANALTTSNGKNSRRRGATEPAPPEGGWVQGDQWVRDEDRDGVLVPVQVLVWDGAGFVPEQIIADDILVIGEDGTVRIKDDTVTAGAIAADALDFKTARGAQFYGGYIEAPTIASSSTLGSGANVLDDPEFVSAVNSAWVLSGHAGDAAATQRDTIAWDQAWTAAKILGGSEARRNWGSVKADLALTPGSRRTGSIVMPNYSWLNITPRTLTNPYTFKANATWNESLSMNGGAPDPTFKAVDSRAPGAGSEKTTYLTNSAVISVVAGERWNIRLAYEKLTDETVGFVASAAFEVVNATTGVVLHTRTISAPELKVGNIVEWWDSAFTGTVKCRVKATYTAGGGGGPFGSGTSGGAVRSVTSDSFARWSIDGTQQTAWLGNGSNKRLPYKTAPQADTFTSLLGTHGLAYTLRAGFAWNIQSAVFAKVEPARGWRLTEEFGAEFFNSLGARTGRIDGEDNYFTGRIGTAESGERWELEGDAITLYDEYGQPLGAMKRSGPGVTTSFNTFALKSQLDAWAPIDGTHAWVTSEGREYVRSSGRWCLLPDASKDTVGLVPLPGTPATGITAETQAEYEVRSGWVVLRFYVFGDIAESAAQDVWSGVPTQLRPPTNRFAAAWLAGGYVGTAFVRSNGTVAVANRSGATRTSSQFTIVYPLP